MTNDNRIKNVIGRDRLSFSQEYLSLITIDLKKVLEQYFEIPKDLSFKINPRVNGYDFCLQGSALRIKPFNILPK